jgi:hypothetical protein
MVYVAAVGRKEEDRTHSKLLFHLRKTTHTFMDHHKMNVEYWEWPGLVAQCVSELDPTTWSPCGHLYRSLVRCLRTVKSMSLLYAIKQNARYIQHPWGGSLKKSQSLMRWTSLPDASSRPIVGGP